MEVTDAQGQNETEIFGGRDLFAICSRVTDSFHIWHTGIEYSNDIRIHETI
jgi:hypothetical protein